MRKRIISVCLIITILFVSLSGRIGYIVFSNAYIASSGYNSYELIIDSKYPTLYYRDGTKATNNLHKYVAVIRPNPKCIGELNVLFNLREINEITEELKNGHPIIKELEHKPKNKLNHIKIVEYLSDDNALEQLISKKSNGLLNRTGKEIGQLSVNYSLDANGRLLDGDVGKIINKNYDSMFGYRLSIDRKIQNISVNASRNLKKGCIIVMNIEDCSILACVNKPYSDFNIKAINQYSVGSVFKLVIAACSIENGIDLIFDCNGSVKVNDSVFSCQRHHIHGMQTLKEALANSCNCYFVNLANYLGKDKLLDTCFKLGFNDNINLFSNWSFKSSVLPTKEELNSLGELSLFGFGQGKLLVSPLQVGVLLSTIGNNGYYNVPRLIISNVNDKYKSDFITYPKKRKVLSKQTSDKLIDCMRFVVTSGTGINAESSIGKSAGKTATAQTGQYSPFGVEKLNTWFAGVYPYDNPKYAIVIMKEEGESGSKDCCPIFRTIVDSL